MPSEAIRCTDCGAVFKGVPAWLSTASVKFSCTNCPKRPSRLARFDAAPAASLIKAKDEDDDDLDAVEIEDLDEDAEPDIDEDDSKAE